MKIQVHCPHCGKEINMEKEKGFTFLLKENREAIKEEIQQEYSLKIKEKEKIVDDLKIKLDEARQRIENHSHSQQLSGETMELALEEMLRRTYPTDYIHEVPKGITGADCIQVVKTKEDIEIGKIIYEVKNTQSFSSGWISKLKKDNLKAKADIMIIVTRTMPKDIKAKFVLVDDIWVCQYSFVQELTFALRVLLMKLQIQTVTLDGKETKSQLLFNYVTSSEFQNILNGILTGFKTMQDSHQNEKLKLALMWKEREAALEQILSNTVEFYGSLKGIIPSISMLDVPQAN